MATKLFPSDITKALISTYGVFDSSIFWGGALTASFLNSLASAGVPQDTINDIDSQVNDYVADNPELSVEEVNEELENIVINEIQQNEVAAIKKQYGTFHAFWLPSDSKHPSLTHEGLYGKKFLISKGLYDKDYKKYFIPGERDFCRCGMEIIGL